MSYPIYGNIIKNKLLNLYISTLKLQSIPKDEVYDKLVDSSIKIIGRDNSLYLLTNFSNRYDFNKVYCENIDLLNPMEMLPPFEPSFRDAITDEYIEGDISLDTYTKYWWLLEKINPGLMNLIEIP